jgi:anti-sigma B factor antagonist
VAALELRRQIVGAVLVVHVVGEVDLASSAVFQQYLVDQIDEEHADVVVDLSGVGFMDSTGLAALLAVYNAVNALGGSLHLAGATGEARRVLGITQLDVMFDHHADISDAIEAALRRAGGGEPRQ